MHLNRRLTAHIGLLLGLALVAGACNGDDPDQATDGTTTTEVDPTTTTTTTEPTTTTFPIEGPEPWTDIVRDLYERRWALQTNPDPTAVAAVYSQNCDCYPGFLQEAQILAASGQHFEGEPPRPVALQLTGDGGGGFQRVIVKVQLGPQRLVDSTGAVLQETPGREPVCVSLLLAPSGPGDQHQIHDYFVPQGCPEGL
jgi:hypothetical protein